MLSNCALPVALAWQVWSWVVVKLRCAGRSCIFGMDLDVRKSRSAGSSCVAGVALGCYQFALSWITFTAHGLNTFRQDRQLTAHQDGARFYGTLYMGMTRDANGVELVTVDRP